MDDFDVMQMIEAGQALIACGRLAEARRYFRKLPDTCLIPSSCCTELGWWCLDIGMPDEADYWFRRATAVDPHERVVRLSVAAFRQSIGEADAAVELYSSLVVDCPEDFEALMGRGSALLDRGKFVDAEQAFRQAIECDQDHASAWTMLGIALDLQDRGGEALVAHRRSAELPTETIDGFVDFASSLRDQGQIEEALDVLKQATQTPHSPRARMLLGQVLLTLGRLREGFEQYEQRFLTPHFVARRPRFLKPRWRGQPLAGKTILLRAEQGMGDTFQFARYAVAIKALDATVVLAVPPELVRVARGFAGVDRVVILHVEEATCEFDFYLPLLSAPGVFGTTLTSIPAPIPYLEVLREGATRISYQFDPDENGLRVGIAWAGNPMHPQDRFRSMSLANFATLGRVPGVRLFSLQKGAGETEIREATPPVDVVDLGPFLKDFADTAAAIAQLDLVVSVDTAVAHLAGALGKPVWLLVPQPSEWRWPRTGTDTPWYPTFRLFRQTRRGDWSEALTALRSELELLTRRVAKPATNSSPRPGSAVQAVLPAEPIADSMRTVRLDECTEFAETRAGILQFRQGASIVGNALSLYGDWLHAHLTLLGPFVRTGSVLIEVGAGTGIHSIQLSRQLGDEGTLLLMEPRVEMHDLLNANLLMNGVGNATVLNRRQLRESRAEIRDSVDALQLASLQGIKINEGMDVNSVLDGASATLWRLRPWVFAAVMDDEDSSGLISRLRDHSYRCWVNATTLFDIRNFNARTEDIFPGRLARAFMALPEELPLTCGGAEWHELL